MNTKEVFFTVAVTVPANNPDARGFLLDALEAANDDAINDTIGVTPIKARLVEEPT